MFNSKLSRIIVPSLTVLTLFSSCGSSGVTGTGLSTSNNQNNNTSNYIPPTDDGSGYAALPFDFSVYGLSSGTTSSKTTTEIATDNLLKVKVSALAATENQGTSTPTPYTANYTCAIYKVSLERKVNGVWMELSTKTTAPISVNLSAYAENWGCTGAKENETIDFSGYLASGHNFVRVKVTALRTNHYCSTYGYGCPTFAVYQYHTVNGSLDIQINGTTL